jgi:hypothetical protein
MPGGQNATIEDVIALRNRGDVLQSYEARNESCDAWMHGLDPIDVVAGDGNLIFCTPYGPVQTAGSYAKRFRAPGVVFRLSDLIATGQPISVRPVDFQTFYIEFLTLAGLSDVVAQIQRDADSLPGAIDALRDLGPILSRIREYVEVSDPRAGLQMLDAGKSPRGQWVFNFSTEAEIALSLIEAYAHSLSPSPEETEHFDAWRELLEQAATNVTHQGLTSWVTAKKENAEMCIGGSLPLSLAVATFDSNSLRVFEPGALDGLIQGGRPQSILASATGNRLERLR